MNKRNISVTLISLAVLLMSVSVQAEKVPGIEGVYNTLPGEKFKFDGKTVEIVEFMSFYCHTCYDFEKSIPIIKGNFPKKIKWKLVPIYWGDKGSPKPGEAYIIAREMGKGEAMKKALFKAQMVQKRDIGDINVLESIARQIGLGFDFSKKLRAGEKAKEVQKALDLAKIYGVNETPTIVIAGNMITNAHPMNHDLDKFRTNILAIVSSIFKKKRTLHVD